MENLIENNEVRLEGTVDGDPQFSHEIYGEIFMKFPLKVKRLSDNFDNIILTVSERILDCTPVEVGDEISVTGQFRSYNNYTDEGSKLVLTVFVKKINEECESSETPNSIFINGYICKPPVYRTTPFGREICDALIAVNRQYGKSDYLPCIMWGRNAKFTENLPVGTNVRLWGRIQSREYKKKIDEENFVIKTAYEVSVTKMEVASEVLQNNF